MLTVNSSILISILLVILNGVFSDPSFIHDTNSASTTSIGTETPYSIRIQTENISGLTQLEFYIPNSLSVSVIEDQNADVTTGDNSISFLWADLNSDEISIELRLSPMNGFNSGAITPTISYMNNGERINVILKKTIINTFPICVDLDQKSKGISCVRTITAEEDGITKVDLTIKGNNYDGFIKITENIPTNCLFEIVNTGGSVAEEENGTLKFVWFDTKSPLPITVSYRLLGCSGDNLNDLSGEIRYAFGNHEFYQDIALLTQNFPEDDVLNNISQIADDSAPILVTQFNNHNALTPDNGVAYRVQLLAGHNDVSRTWISNTYNFSGPADTELHEGWIKYTTGSFPVYKQARNERENINKTHHFPQPFVTAYYCGERISVEEALVISQQDWIP
ncbi:MAG: hypothetical protein COA49_01955 [Bacteroidetes bacterium]|nr:MAG: hypothetical protein COA49_01955 [Bacteroidota bacterium]